MRLKISRLGVLAVIISLLCLGSTGTWAQAVNSRQPLDEDEGAMFQIANEILEKVEVSGKIFSPVERAKMEPAIAAAIHAYCKTKNCLSSLVKGFSFNHPDSELAVLLVWAVKVFVVMPALAITGNAGLIPVVGAVPFKVLVGIPYFVTSSNRKHRLMHQAAGMDPADLLRRILPGIDLNRAELIQLSYIDSDQSKRTLILPVSERDGVEGAVSISEIESALELENLDGLRAMGLDPETYKLTSVRDVMKSKKPAAIALANKMKELNRASDVKQSPLLLFYMETKNLIRRAEVESDFHSPHLSFNPCEWSLTMGSNWAQGIKSNCVSRNRPLS